MARAAVVLAALLAAAPALSEGSDAGPPARTSLWVEQTDTPVPPSRTATPDFRAIARFARPSVVSITATSNEDGPNVESDNPSAREFFERFYGGAEPPTKGMASGFIIRSDGYILTNEHVVEDASALAVTLGDDDGRSYPARVIGRDDLSDLALIKIDADRPLQALPLGDSTQVEVGDWVTVIGNPFGLSNSLSVGVVSFMGRRDINPSGRPGYYDFIQTDAAINPGNSGGPVVDSAGRVIGISAAVNSSGQGIGFAIPINMAKDVLPALYDTGMLRRSFLGVSIQDMSPDLADSFGVKSGVVVTEVTSDSPAAKAGILVGDVVTSFDGAPIGQAYRLRWLTSSAGVGTKVSIGLLRRGRPITATAVLSPLSGAGGRFHREPPPRPRPDLAPVGFSVSGPINVPSGRGLRVTAIDPLSQAYTAGLREGDMVLLIGERAVHGPRDLQAVAAKTHGVIRLFIQRGLKPMYVAFRIS